MTHKHNLETFKFKENTFATNFAHIATIHHDWDTVRCIVPTEFPRKPLLIDKPFENQILLLIRDSMVSILITGDASAGPDKASLKIGQWDKPIVKPTQPETKWILAGNVEDVSEEMKAHLLFHMWPLGRYLEDMFCVQWFLFA